MELLGVGFEMGDPMPPGGVGGVGPGRARRVPLVWAGVDSAADDNNRPGGFVT